MAVIKITITNQESFQQACDLTDVKIKKTSEINGTRIFEVAFKHPKQLFEAGMLYAEYCKQPVKKEEKQPEKPAENEPGKGIKKPVKK